MQYTTKRISWKTWFKPERNWKLFAKSDIQKWYTPGWLRRVIHIRLTVIYKLNGFGFTWLKRKSYWKTHFAESVVSSCGLSRWSEALDVSFEDFPFSSLTLFWKGNQLLKMLPNLRLPTSLLHLPWVKDVIVLKTFWFSLIRILP